MAAEDRIKAINAEAKARENLKKVEADLAKMEKANAEKQHTYSQREIRNLKEKKQKVEAYLEKVEGIKDAAEAFKDTADNISLSSRATSQLSSAISTVTKNYKAISSIDLGTPENQKEAAASFVNAFQESASMMQNAQAELMNASNEEERTIALGNIEAAQNQLKSLTATHGKFLTQNAAANNFLQDYIKGTQSVNEQIKVTSGLSAEQVEQYKELTAEADKMSTRMKAVGNQITTALKKPNVLIGLMFVGLGKVASALGKTTREMGGFVGGLTGATSQVTALSVVFPTALESAKGLSSEFGGLADTSFDTQLNTNLMAMNMGISGKEAAQLVGNFARLNGGSIETAQNLAASTKELAKANGLMPSQVMADVAGSAQAFAEYGKAGGTNIAEAAVAAGQLGTNLATATKLTDQLLDFENSINQELELGARLGKNINFQKARELAYQGDIKGSLQAALQQLGGIEAFNRMDYFQKKAAAAALGLQSDELQKMLSNMDKLNKDGSIQVSQFDQMKEALTGFATGFGGQMLQTLGYMAMIAPGIGKIFSGIGKAFKFIGTGIGKIAGGLKDAVVSSAKFLVNLIKIAAQKLGFGGAEAGAALNPFEVAKSKGLSDKQILAGFGGKEAKDMMAIPESATDSIADKAKDKVSDKAEDLVDDKLDSVADKISDKAEGVAPDESIGGKLTSLASGLTAMGTGRVLKGALNLIPTALGFIAILPGIPGMFLVGKTGISAGKGLIGLAAGLTAMNGTLGGSTSLAVAGLGFSLMTAGIIGMGGVALLGAAAGKGLLGLAPGLLAMAPTVVGSTSLILAGLGFSLMIPGIVGMGGVALLGVTAGAGLIGLAAGLMAMAPTVAGSAALLLAASAFTLMIPGSIGMLMIGVAAPIAAFGIFALIPALTALGGLMASGVGALGLLAFVGMAIGLASAFTLIGAGAMMFGKGIELAANSLGSFLPKLSNFMESISLGQVATIGLLSLAFVGLAASLIYLGAAGLFALPALLGITAASAGIELAANSLGNFLPKLSNFMESITLGQVATIGLLSLAFMGLAASLMFLGAAGLYALPALLGIAAASAGIAMVAEVFGFAGGESKSEETTALESESVSTFEKDVLTEIRNVATALKQGMIVNLDGRQVNQGLERATGRSLENNILAGNK